MTLFNRKPKVKKICQQCHEEFEITPGDEARGRGKFCSQRCFGDSKTERVIATCLVCDKDFETFPSVVEYGNGKYCSKACHKIAQRNRKSVRCLQCREAFEVYAKRAEIAVFCSLECSGAFRDTGVSIECKNCRKPIKPRRKELDKGLGVYCSRDCYQAQLGDKKRKSGYMTDIEALCYEAFQEYGLNPSSDFIFEYSVGRKRVDFYFPAFRVAVEANGDYWHSRLFASAKDRDKREFLEAQGITVLEWNGSDIKQGVNHLVECALLPLLGR